MTLVSTTGVSEADNVEQRGVSKRTEELPPSWGSIVLVGPSCLVGMTRPLASGSVRFTLRSFRRS